MLLTPEGFPVEGRTMAAHGLGSLYADRILLHVARRPDEEVWFDQCDCPAVVGGDTQRLLTGASSGN